MSFTTAMRANRLRNLRFMLGAPRGVAQARMYSQSTSMLGHMQEHPLLISSLLEFSGKYHGEQEIVSRRIEDGTIHRYNYAECLDRTRKLHSALRNGLGLKEGDVVGTVAWNGYRHFELYYGVSGMGAVLHTINPRLFPEQIVYIVNHAADQYLFTDLTFVPLLEKLESNFTSVKGVVIMTDKEHMPKTSLQNAICYEELLEGQGVDLEWPQLDERAASSLCYTSGTTGNPKGVLYSHRSTVLHSWAACIPDCLDISSHDSLLPVVPLFHANAWGIAYAAAICGAKLVFPGMGLDGKSIFELLRDEKVTMTAGVPTIWMMLLNHIKEVGGTLPDLKKTVIGGAAVPASMVEAFEKDLGITCIQAWGMTEMSPIGTICNMKPKHKHLQLEDLMDLKVTQGRAVYGAEMKIIDDDGTELPRNGVTFGKLLVRGPWIVDKYYKQDEKAVDDEGWFDTGDIATINEDGYMKIVDRAKDVIKSGGEWISSVDLENAAVGHADVVEAAVVGMPHPKWDERPLLVAVKREGSNLTADQLREFLAESVAKWWIPDGIEFVEELPHTATGKLLKTKIREDFEGYVFSK